MISFSVKIIKEDYYLSSVLFFLVLNAFLYIVLELKYYQGIDLQAKIVIKRGQ